MKALFRTERVMVRVGPLRTDRTTLGGQLSTNQTGAQDVTVGVMGDGFGALLVYTTALYLGFKPDQIGIFGKNLIPTSTYQQFAFNLGQTVLRSESESHFLPADWPTFAELDAWARRSPGFLLRSARRKYNPGVPDILAEARVVQERLAWNESRFPARVGWLQREGEDTDDPHF